MARFSEKEIETARDIHKSIKKQDNHSRSMFLYGQISMYDELGMVKEDLKEKEPESVFNNATDIDKEENKILEQSSNFCEKEFSIGITGSTNSSYLTDSSWLDKYGKEDEEEKEYILPKVEYGNFYKPSFNPERKFFKVIDFIFYRIIFNWWIWIAYTYIDFLFIKTDKEVTNKNVILFIAFCLFAITNTFQKKDKK